MVTVLVDGARDAIKGWASNDRPPLTSIFFPEEKVRSGNWVFLCPDCETDEFETYSCSVCECCSCTRKIVFIWDES